MDVNAFIKWLEDLPTDKLLSVEEVLCSAKKYLVEEEEELISSEQIIDYLNSQAGTTFTNKSRKTKQLIGARLKEGYTFVDFKIVIDKKVRQWLGTEQAVYLRPMTLFNATKFETYLNESEIISKKQNGKQTKLDKIKSEVTNATQSNWGLD